MIFADLREEGMPPRPLPFYLAMEEHLARNREGEYFFMWQVSPTVIFGRNQVIDAEVNLDYCRREGIRTYRRKSGGGCVFADMNNIMFSHVTSSENVTTTFSGYTRKVAEMLRSLGLDASASGRNDVMIGERKVSGNAFYHIPGRSIVHGTMLFDTDMEKMTNALTPSRVKLGAKGVASVRSRITTVREHLPSLSIGEFKRAARDFMCDSVEALSPADIEEINRIAAPYFTDEWIYGRRYGNRPVAPRRVEGVGEFFVDMERGSDGRIASVNLSGDFFLTGELDALLHRFTGAFPTEESLEAAIGDFPVSDVIAGLSPRALVKLLIP